MSPSINDGVGRVVIPFTLGQVEEKIELHLARAGAETTIVTMPGSDESSVWGACTPSLGRMERGPHILKRTMADDGKGNGRYAWDAFSLFAR